jgi:hypothetical protein
LKLKASIKDLKAEVSQIRKRNAKFKDDSAFVYWFLQAFLVNSEHLAKQALTGDTSDKNIDAIFIDDKAKQVNIIQGKFRLSHDHSEKRNDVLAFADLSMLPWASKSELTAFYSKLDPLVEQKLQEAIETVRSKKYELKLFYVTTGKCSETIVREARERVRQAEGPADILVFDYKRVIVLFKDYLVDAAPPVHTLTLRIITEGPIQHEGVIRRYDPERKTESWVFTASGRDIAEMYAKEKMRLFARNIRGYLGDTDINDSMGDTIDKEPHNFWYYNNGITMVCNDAKRELQEGEDVLIVEGAQVINGQQTTRTLDKHPERAKDTHVLVKVIRIPRTPGDDEQYDSLVNSIVRATNWQNYISPSDLVSNDYIQVFLQKELRKRGYQYIRKKMKKSEAKRLFESEDFFQIDKKEMAQAVAACIFDPVVVRKGKEGLFEDPYYKSVFGSHSISYYLPKYWLMKQVQYAARGYPERAYAKWLILNFAWSLLGKNISSGIGERRFRYACEQKDKILSNLHKALDDMFRAALRFYRLKRGTGEKAKDVSTFFKASGLHTNFYGFWNSSKNPYREKVKDHLKKFEARLESLPIEE